MTRRLVAAAAVMFLVWAAIFATPAAAEFRSTPGPASAPEYWFDSWDVPDIWAAGARGQGITIAEIDTGVTVVPELAGRVLPGIDLGSLGGDGRTDRDNNPFGHGTGMASIMVARPGPYDITGLAPLAKILPIAIPLTETSEAGEPDRLADAIRYAASHGAKIINMSLGGKRSPSDDSLPCPTNEQQAIYYALAKGAILTAAVGNTGRNTVEDPGVCLGVVAVAAADVTGNVASFSTREPYVAFAAPGVSIPSLGRVDGQPWHGNGTSQATAIASASLALIWSKYPTESSRQILARVFATLADKRASPSPGDGYGLLDTGQAVRAAVPTDAPDPVYTAVEPFLARYRAAAAARHVPSPAAASGGTGRYAVGSSPRPSDNQELVGVLFSSGGILVFLVLGAVWRFAPTRRRRVLVADTDSSSGRRSGEPSPKT